MNRPFSVIVICVFYGLLGLLFALGGIKELVKWWEAFSAFVTCAGMVFMVVAVGLWKFKRWASNVAIILGGAWLLVLSLGFVSDQTNARGAELALALIILFGLLWAILLNETGKGTFIS